MTQKLKKSTASQVIAFGPIMDDDGLTPKTGLTIANTDIKLIKAAGTSQVSKNSGGATEIGNGYYYATFDATDTDTAGTLLVGIQMTGCAPFFREWEVLPTNVYDAMTAGTDALEVDTIQVSGTTQTAGDLYDVIEEIRALVGGNWVKDTITYDGTTGKCTGAILKVYSDAAHTTLIKTVTITTTYSSSNLSTMTGAES